MKEEDDSSTDEELLVRVFPIRSDVKVDLNQLPTSGEEFLRRVQMETRSLPSVVIAKIDEKKITQTDPCTFAHSLTSNFMKMDKRWLTTELQTWEQTNLSQFDQMAENVQTLLSCKESIQVTNDNQTIDSKFWSTHCFLSRDNQDEFASSTELSLPKISILRQMDVRKIQEGIRFFTRCFKELRFYSHFHGMWLYSLLACLEKPLRDDLCSSLRELSSVCSLLRSKLDPESDADKFKSLHLIICIIGKHFQQRDMTDDYNF